MSCNIELENLSNLCGEKTKVTTNLRSEIKDCGLLSAKLVSFDF